MAEAKKSADIKDKKENPKVLGTPRQIYCTSIRLHTNTKTPWWKRVWTAIKQGWKFIGILLTISGLIVFRDRIHDLITPREKLWKERSYLNGIRIPLDQIDKSKGISVIIGGNMEH